MPTMNTERMKAVILARVSTREQEQGYSIDAQDSRLREYSERKELKVIKVFRIIESSTRGARKDFMDMIEFIKEQDEPIALVADAVDRVQRSFKESVLLDELRKQGKIEIHFFRENLVLNNNSKSFEIMMWDFAVMGAKSYVLNLSDNVKRSNDHKLKNGEWLTKAPIGYKNTIDTITGKKTIIVDEERGYLIRKGFELYATGNYSVESIADILRKDGLTNATKARRPFSSSQVHRLLQNPFYYGVMRIKDELYPHHYERLIDEQLFRTCEDVRLAYHKKPFKYAAKPYCLRGLTKCSECGCSIIFYTKKGKYTYAKCTEYRGKHGAKLVREETILNQIKDTFKQLSIPEDVLKDLQQRIQQSHDAKMHYHKDAIANIRSQANRVQAQLDELLNMRLNKSITQSEYDEKAKQLREQLYDLNQKEKAHIEADEKYAITVNYLLNLAHRAHDLFESSKVDQKRALINFALSNLQWDGVKLHFELRKPFDAVLAANQSRMWFRDRDSNPSFQIQSLTSCR